MDIVLEIKGRDPMNSLLNEWSLRVGSIGICARAGAFQHIINDLEQRMNSIVKKTSNRY